MLHKYVDEVVILDVDVVFIKYSGPVLIPDVFNESDFGHFIISSTIRG